MDNKLSGDPKKDFPELFSNEIDNFDDNQNDISIYLDERQKENEYIKKSIIEEVIDHAEVRKDLSIYDKRLKRPLYKRFFDALFGND